MLHLHRNPFVFVVGALMLSAPLALSQSCPPSTNTSNFNGTSIAGGDVIWFSANFTASGVPSTGATLTFNNSTITFTADQLYTVAVPNAQIVFDPHAVCAVTT